MKLGIQLLLFTLLIFGVTGKLNAQNTKKPFVQDTFKLTYRIINAAGGSYGYEVYQQGKLLIHQPTIPALPGNKGFATKDAAEKVVHLVIRKIERGEMPPTITIEEMKSLKAL